MALFDHLGGAKEDRWRNREAKRAHDYARLKGERDAIKRASIRKKCAIEFRPISPPKKEDEPELEAEPQSDLDVVTLVFRIEGNAVNIREIRIGSPEKNGISPRSREGLASRSTIRPRSGQGLPGLEVVSHADAQQVLIYVKVHARNIEGVFIDGVGVFGSGADVTP